MYATSIAEEDPDRVAITMARSGETLTYSQLDENANRLAHVFRKHGLTRGDHVAFVMENHIRYFELMSAAERTGLYYTCVNSHLTADELAYILTDCHAQVVISSPAVREKLVAAAGTMSGDRMWLEVGDDNPPAPLRSYERAVAQRPADPVADEQLGASMLYSSGTTGRPKGILRPLPDSHPAQALAVFEFVQKRLFLMEPGMTYLAPTPLYHSAPQSAISGCIRLGAHAIVMEKFDPEEFLRLVDEHRVTHTQIVPTMMRRLVRLPSETRDKYDVSSLRVLVHAAAPCPVPLKREMIEWFGPILHEYYASTEAVGGTIIDSSEWLAHPGSVGKPAFGDLEIHDENGQPCPTGVTGRVWFSGATSFEYFNTPEKTAEAFDGVGTVVGDLGYVDADGYLYLTDRESFMILSGGVNVYPQETEDVLSAHPCVADVAVFGVPDDDLGETVKALVVPSAGHRSPELPEELHRYCRSKLSTIKCPRSIELVDDLPRTDAGKLLKGPLRDQYRA